MLSIIVTVVICLLAAAGAYFLFEKFCAFFCVEENNFSKAPFLIIPVKNSQNSVEFDTRTYIWKLLSQNGGKVPFEIFILDLNSADSTFEISKKLSKEYEFMHAVEKNEFINIIENEFN